MLSNLWIVLALAGGAAAPVAADGERLSLEELLSRYRARRDALLGELSREVELTLADIEAAADAGRPGEVEAGYAELVKLGQPCAPLLVNAIDPGPGATDPQKTRARTVARALRELRSSAVTEPLLTMLARGSGEGRRNALRVLATSAEVERVSAAIRAHYAEAKGEARLFALAALAELGGEANERFVGELLASEDREVAAYALRALAESGRPSAAAQVLALMRNTTAAAPLVGSILDYYRAVPEAVDGATCEALLALVKSRRPTAADSVKLLELLPAFERQWSSSVKRDLKELAETGGSGVAEAALVALARTGDRSAKKTLLEPYDKAVEDQRNWANAWEDRAGIHYRIGDYKSALRDYTEALRVGRDGGRHQGEVHVQMARCYALTGKLKEAADKIEKAPITLAERRALADDPAFAELMSSSRYREVFRLEDGR